MIVTIRKADARIVPSDPNGDVGPPHDELVVVYFTLDVAGDDVCGISQDSVMTMALTLPGSAKREPLETVVSRASEGLSEWLRSVAEGLDRKP